MNNWNTFVSWKYCVDLSTNTLQGVVLHITPSDMYDMQRTACFKAGLMTHPIFGLPHCRQDVLQAPFLSFNSKAKNSYPEVSREVLKHFRGQTSQTLAKLGGVIWSGVTGFI